MKTTKLGLETLNARCLMSASPWGEIAAPAPEPPASDALSYNFGGIEGSASGMQQTEQHVGGMFSATTPEEGAASAMAELLRKTLENAKTLMTEAGSNDGHLILPAAGTDGATHTRPVWDWIKRRDQHEENSFSPIIVTNHGQSDRSQPAGVVNNVFTPWTADSQDATLVVNKLRGVLNASPDDGSAATQGIAGRKVASAMAELLRNSAQDDATESANVQELQGIWGGSGNDSADDGSAATQGRYTFAIVRNPGRAN